MLDHSISSGSPHILSSETLSIMRSRVTAPGASDAVLRVPLEFGMGYEQRGAAHEPHLFPPLQTLLNFWADLWLAAMFPGKSTRVTAALATRARGAAFHLETHRTRWVLCCCPAFILYFCSRFSHICMTATLHCAFEPLGHCIPCSHFSNLCWLRGLLAPWPS